MPESKSKSAKVGDTIDIKSGGEVTRPDGATVKVVGGSYVLSQAGDYVVDGQELTVK